MAPIPLDISGRTPVYCVIGHPVAHSVSPAMQNAALSRQRGAGIYVAFDVAPADLRAALDGMQALGIRGVNVTIPHKQGILPHLDKLSPEARLIGAVNTVEFRADGRWGHNTDAPGFLQSLRRQGVEPRQRRAVILGAGGSARAVGVALAREETTLTITNRTASRATELAEHLNRHVRSGLARTAAPASEALRQAIQDAALVVNTTAVGMIPHADVDPPVPAAWLHPGCFVYDLIYNPLETTLLRAARQAGAPHANGAQMLAFQGALSMEIWTGQPVPDGIRDVMEATVRQSLQD